MFFLLNFSLKIIVFANIFIYGSRCKLTYIFHFYNFVKIYKYEIYKYEIGNKWLILNSCLLKISHLYFDIVFFHHFAPVILSPAYCHHRESNLLSLRSFYLIKIKKEKR